MSNDNNTTPAPEADKVFIFTEEDICAVTGLKASSLGTYSRQGKIDLHDLESIVSFCVEKRSRNAPKEDPLADERLFVQKQLGIGVNILGKKENGHLIFALPFTAEQPEFRDLGKQMTQKLCEMGYALGTWEADNGSFTHGFAQVPAST